MRSKNSANLLLPYIAGLVGEKKCRHSTYKHGQYYLDAFLQGSFGIIVRVHECSVQFECRRALEQERANVKFNVLRSLGLMILVKQLLQFFQEGLVDHVDQLDVGKDQFEVVLVDEIRVIH